MTAPFSPQRSDAIRAALETTVANGAPRRARRHWLPALGLVSLGVVTGAAVSAAALSANWPSSSSVMTEAGIPAPPGILPGEPIISLLGDLSSQVVDGTTTIVLGSAPTGATHVRVSVSCMTAGETRWGIDPGGNNPGSSCRTDDLAGASAAYFDFSLESSPAALYIDAAAGVQSIVTYQYVNYVQTVWGVNARGETFGVEKEGTDGPDLTAVTGENSLGETVEGYARRSELMGFGPDWPEMPSTPEEALAWQEERAMRYPTGWDVVIYESDGITPIGVFHVRND